MSVLLSKEAIRLLRTVSHDLVIDLFAGGGGTSAGLEDAIKRPVDVALNHDAVAIAVHAKNHPNTVHIQEDIWNVRPRDVVGRRKVWILWASPDCKHFSSAKGAEPLDNKIRMLAEAVVDWVSDLLPEFVFLENVVEFRKYGPLGADRRPIKEREGEYFDRFIGKLQLLGYRVEWRILDSSEFGVPTKRRRFYLVARRDQRPIEWPQPTHGAGLLPLRGAVECIDWSLPCPSIFLTKEEARALAKIDPRIGNIKRPLAPKTLWRVAHGFKYFVQDHPDPYIRPVDGNLEAPFMVQSGYGERPTQRARWLDMHKPLGTVVGCGPRHALVTAFLTKHFGDYGDPRKVKHLNKDVRDPLGTVTARDHTSISAVTLLRLNHDDHGVDIRKPMPTVLAGGFHVAQVQAFLTAYFGSDGQKGKGQDVRDPMRTVTTKPRLGLVTVYGDQYEVADIGYRMLKPDPELLRAQFDEYAEGYDLSPAETDEEKNRMVGNSVVPKMAKLIVEANISTSDSYRRAA